MNGLCALLQVFPVIRCTNAGQPVDARSTGARRRSKLLGSALCGNSNVHWIMAARGWLGAQQQQPRLLVLLLIAGMNWVASLPTPSSPPTLL